MRLPPRVLLQPQKFRGYFLKSAFTRHTIVTLKAEPSQNKEKRHSGNKSLREKVNRHLFAQNMSFNDAALHETALYFNNHFRDCHNGFQCHSCSCADPGHHYKQRAGHIAIRFAKLPAMTSHDLPLVCTIHRVVSHICFIRASSLNEKQSWTP